MKKNTSPTSITMDALKYDGEWIALSPDYQEVLGHGKTAYEASEMAKKSRYGFGILFCMSSDWDRPHVFSS